MMIKLVLSICTVFAFVFSAISQNPEPFTCSGSDGFGYFSSSATNTIDGSILTYSSSRISKITTLTGDRSTLCEAATIGVSLNGLAFNPHDNFLYGVSRYDANVFSGILYRIGENCQKVEIPVSGPMIKFTTNDVVTVDAAGGNISSATFDLDNHYYVNSSFANAASVGFTNKLQTLLLDNNTATVQNTVTLTCPSCNTSKLRITDISFDEATGLLMGTNKETGSLYSIDPTTGVLIEVGSTNISSTILGTYKNRDGNVRAISEGGSIYSVNTVTGAFTLISSFMTLNSGNADAASGCFAPPKITGNLFVDANGLTDNTVNGIGANLAGSMPIYANLIENGKVIRSVALDSDGYYEFLGLLTGNYQVQLSTSEGTIGQSAPVQGLPSTYMWVGDHRGVNAGSDGTPNGTQNVTISMGLDMEDVNFGINGIPITTGLTTAPQNNPNGEVQVIVPALTFSDPEEPAIDNITIQALPNPSDGILYYNGLPVTAGQYIPNYNPNLLTVDPVNGDVTVSFTFFTTDMAGVNSNVSVVEIPFIFTVLPVELLDFSGRNDGDENILAWSTASEVNSNYFIIEKRQKSGDFEEIGKIDAKGSSFTKTQYTFIDQDINRISYYRLVQVDIDGVSYIYNTVAIESRVSVEVKIYPTLATEEITVELSDIPEQDYQYQIMDVSGRTISTGLLNISSTNIDIASLNKGAFFLRVFVPNVGSKSLRFIKM